MVFFIMTVLIYISNNSIQEFPFPHIHTKLVICNNIKYFDNSHSKSVGGDISLWFDLHFPDD